MCCFHVTSKQPTKPSFKNPPYKNRYPRTLAIFFHLLYNPIMNKITITEETVQVEGGHTYETFIKSMLNAIGVQTFSMLNAVPEEHRYKTAEFIYDELNLAFGELLSLLPCSDSKLTEDAQTLLKAENRILSKESKKKRKKGK